MKETGMIKFENNIFSKIKNFFKKIFFKQKEEKIQEEKREEIHEEIEIKNEILNDKTDFKSNLKIDEDKEKIRLLKLQEEFSKGNITEEDMAEEDIEKLHVLYNEQIAALEKSTEEYKQKIIQIRKNM